MHRFVTLGLSLTLATLFSQPALAHHGPGTTGGVSTRSAETLPRGAFSLGLHFDYTRYENLSKAEIRRRTFDVGGDHSHFDALRWSLIETLEFAYGVSDDFEVGASIGYYRADQVREGHLHDDGSYGFHEFGDVSGIADQWFNVAYRLLRREDWAFSMFGGIKLPTGEDDESSESSEDNAPLEAGLQPGSGAFDFLASGAFSRNMSDRLSLDTSATYTFHTTEEGYRIGDRLLAGAALNYRITEGRHAFPAVGLIGEAVLRYSLENEEDGEEIVNTGGLDMLVAPGCRIAFSEYARAVLSIRIPVLEDLNDVQQETDFKVSIGVNFSF